MYTKLYTLSHSISLFCDFFKKFIYNYQVIMLFHNTCYGYIFSITVEVYTFIIIYLSMVDLGIKYYYMGNNKTIFLIFRNSYLMMS